MDSEYWVPVVFLILLAAVIGLFIGLAVSDTQQMEARVEDAIAVNAIAMRETGQPIMPPSFDKWSKTHQAPVVAAVLQWKTENEVPRVKQ